MCADLYYHRCSFTRTIISITLPYDSVSRRNGVMARAARSASVQAAMPSSAVCAPGCAAARWTRGGGSSSVNSLREPCEHAGRQMIAGWTTKLEDIALRKVDLPRQQFP